METPVNSSRWTEVLRRHKMFASALLSVALLVGGVGIASPAGAQDSYLPGQCIYVDGMQRGCAKDILVRFGNGLYWSGSASVRDTMWDNGTVTLEMSLHRKLPSNTPWMLVSRSVDGAQYYSNKGITGHDPTYGAWVRLCANLSTGKRCLAPRYVYDRS